MTSNFSTNRIFEENLEINFTVSGGTFTTNGQTLIVQHAPAIQNLSTLTNWDAGFANVDANNYFTVEYRWSYDTVTWTPWATMPDDFSDFPSPNTQPNVWLQVKFTYVTDLTKQAQVKELNIYGTRTIAEIFEPIVLTDSTPVVYSNADTYKVFALEDYAIFLSTGNAADLKLDFRFTQTQGRTWSPWVPLTAENLRKTRFERLKFCNFQFAFQNTGAAPVGIFDLELIGEFQNVTANYQTISRLGLKTQCNPLAIKPAPTGPCDDDCQNGTATACCDSCLAGSEGLTPWNQNIESSPVCTGNFVQINDRKLWASQILLNEQLNEFIAASNSWKCTYLLTDPDGKGIDHILHEQQIHNVIAMKDLNIIVPDNQFPTDTLNFSGLDLDLIQSFEIHILKKTFKNTFGVEFRPGKKDVVYICDINQLWEVEQMFPKRGFMNAEIYYRVLMKKYNDRKSRQYANTADGQKAKDFVTELTKYTTLDGLFGIDNDSEVKKNTKDNKILVDTPSQQYTATSLLTVRKSMADKATIENTEIWNASLTVAKSVYSLPIKSNGDRLVQYTNTDQVIGLADNRAISFWFKTEDYDPNWDWTLLSNYDYLRNKGYKVNVFNGALTFNLNNNVFAIPIPGFSKDTWYCFLINVDQIQHKLELAIYVRQAEDGASLSNHKLVLFNKMVLDLTPDAFTHAEEIFIGGVNRFTNVSNSKRWFMTNVRIWNQVIGQAERHEVLNQNVVKDAHLTLLVDNAEKVLQLPHYGNI